MLCCMIEFGCELGGSVIKLDISVLGGVGLINIVCDW